MLRKLFLFLLMSICIYGQNETVREAEFQKITGTRITYLGGSSTMSATANTLALQSAITSIANNGAVVIEKGLYMVNSITVPSGVVLRFIPNAIVQVQSGQTLTVNGGIDAGLYQIFDTTGMAESDTC